MDRKTKHKLLIISVLAVGMMLLFKYLTFKEHAISVTPSSYNENTQLSFSAENHFQTQDFDVAITPCNGFSIPGMEIYYTLDGSEPTTHSSLYEKPIHFSVSDENCVYILKAATSYYGKLGAVTTKTYFCGTNIMERYQLPVISITIPEEELYDEDYGIFKHTYKRSENWVRAAHVEILTSSGTPIVEQNVGLSVAGASSSGYPVIPLKLDPDTKWDVKRKIPNLPNLFKSDAILFAPDYQCLEELPSLRLKNGGSFDYYKSVVREATCYSLARDAGLTPLTDMYPAIVYLNGAYYDVMQMCATYSVANLADIYQLEEEQIQLVKGTEWDIADMLAKKSYLLTADYNDAAVVSDFESLFDVDQFLLYYAFEILTDNRDWPNKNVAAWYYSGDYHAGNPYTDGKIRFLYYDGSATYRMITSEEEIFDTLFDQPNEDVCWIYHVLQNPEYRRRFVNIVCDLRNTSLSSEHIHDVIDTESHYLDCETDYIAQAGLGELSDIFSQRSSSVDKFHDKVEETFWATWLGLSNYLAADYFSEEATYTLSLQLPADGVSVQCNSLFITSANQHYDGTYFVNHPACLIARVHDGYAFDGWLVNGECIQQEVLYITADMIRDRQVVIQAKCHNIEGSAPVIQSLSATGVEDWITIYNPYANDMYLGYFYLSNDPNNLVHYQLPKITLHAGECVRIYGKNGLRLGTYKMNMNLSCGKTFYLSDSKGTVMDSVFIPEMPDNAYYEKYCNSTRWCIRTDG